MSTASTARVLARNAANGSAAASPQTAPKHAPPKRSTPLSLVPQRHSSAPRAPFAVVLVTLLAGGLLGLLLLNTLVAQQSFRLHDLAAKGKVLQEREQALSGTVLALRAPAALAARAGVLGMVEAGPPAFLRLSDGKVLGQPTAGVAKPPPVAKVTVPAGSTAGTAKPPTAPAKTAPAKTAPAKMAPGKTAPAKMAPGKTAPAKAVVPAKTAPAKPGVTKIAPHSTTGRGAHR